jgi:uncharacterized membrane protein YfcA
MIKAVSWAEVVGGFTAGLLIAVLTTPVGVSGAVFLLPVQLDLLRVPSPAVTPTNLLFNIVATPGALLRYRSQGHCGGPLVGPLVRATLPGVVLGAVIRVYLVPGVALIRLVGAAVLLPLGLCLWWRDPDRQTQSAGGSLSARTISVLALGVRGWGSAAFNRPLYDRGRSGLGGLPLLASLTGRPSGRSRVFRWCVSSPACRWCAVAVFERAAECRLRGVADVLRDERDLRGSKSRSARRTCEDVLRAGAA